MNTEYYKSKLAANKLKRCYDIASPRIKQYLTAEIDFILKNLQSNNTVLELGCGYGRVMKHLLTKAKEVYGIDTSKESLELAKEYLKGYTNLQLFEMNAVEMKFKENKFDVVIGIQNSISAFKIDPVKLIREGLRVTRKGGTIFLSSYSEKIWDARLEWFIAQSKEGLLGEI
ncbi:MAG: class I SAM-dependent methyltransferase, partial [Candidatus Thorarchaeota archaeon]